LWKPFQCLGAPSFIRFLLVCVCVQPKRNNNKNELARWLLNHKHRKQCPTYYSYSLLTPSSYTHSVSTQAGTQDVKLPLALPAGQGFDLRTRKERKRENKRSS
jgi:hypothetical protein